MSADKVTAKQLAKAVFGWMGTARHLVGPSLCGNVSPAQVVFAPWLKENLMNPNIDFLGICQLLKALRTVGFSETEIKKIARRIAVELGANFTLYA